MAEEDKVQLGNTTWHRASSREEKMENRKETQAEEWKDVVDEEKAAEEKNKKQKNTGYTSKQ